MLHTYYRDPQSGAGNCFCGHPELAYRHPHTFRQAAIEYGGRQGYCTCGQPNAAACHV